MYEKSLLLFIGAIGSLFVIMNPISVSVIFMGLSAEASDKERVKTAFRASLYSFIILLVFFVGGRVIMEFFGISIPGLKIAGGIIVTKVGLSMLSLSNYEKNPDKFFDFKKEDENIAFIPLAMPLLSGPGSIAAIIGLTSDISSKFDYVAIFFGMLAVCIISFLILASASKVHKWIGKTGTEALSKIMGLIVLCVGIQFIIRGIVEVILRPDLAEAIKKIYLN